MSRACGEAVLLPALRAADPDTVTLAAGFSCRTQIRKFSETNRRPVHVTELLAGGLVPTTTG